MTTHIRTSGWIAALAVMCTAAGSAQSVDGLSFIQGHIVHAQTGEPLPLVQVQVEGHRFAATSDLNGRYTLSAIPAGVYRITYRLIGFTPKTVTDVLVEHTGRVELNVTMNAQVIALDAIAVTAELERGASVAILEERQAASTVTNAIGSEEMGRTPDSDASQTLKRVTGLSVAGDRYVVVRGLGDRYSSAQLNGVTLPSTEPDRRAVPLDLFPTNLLERVVTSKTYSPDKPGDYSGGLVDIQTKDFPGGRSVNLSIGAGFNSASSFQDGLGYAGGGRDFLGVDDGTRGLPALVPADQKVIDAVVGDARLEQIAESFSTVWQPRARTVPFNQSFSLSLADETRVLGADLGISAAATYSNSYTHAQLVERVVASIQDPTPETDYAGQRTERTVRWSLFGKADVLLSPTNQLTVRSLFSRTGEDEARELTGFNQDRNTNLQNFSLRFASRSLLSNNLEGEHFLEGLNNTTVNWRVGVSRATSDEPDRREVVYDEVLQGRFAWQELTNSGTRYFTELVDEDLSAQLDLSMPVGASQLKIGGLVIDKDRDFFSRRFRYRGLGGLNGAEFQEPDQLFTPANIGPGMLRLEEDTRRTDNYRGRQHTRAGYAMLDVPLGNLRVVGGGRIESVEQAVNPYDLFPLGLPAVDSAYLDNADFLPGVNLTYQLADGMNVRGAFSRTVARPEFREQAPFDFIDFTGGFLQVGNAALRRSKITNYDLRWEYFPALGNLFAISGFFKSFDDPIEVAVLPTTELVATWTNASSAEVLGLELEARAGLGALGSFLRDVSVGANVTLTTSSVMTGDSITLTTGETIALVDRERSLQGQSPYLINGSLNYANPFSGITMTLLYNRFGRRIDRVGTTVLPDFFEEPRDQLDLVYRMRVAGAASMKISASNLLDASATFTQAGQVVRSATRGRSVSVSFSFGTS